MTFSVLLVENNQPKKVIGTVWANEEGQAAAIARAVCNCEQDKVVVRKAEETEIPLNLGQ